jgi:hypothetical protein
MERAPHANWMFARLSDGKELYGLLIYSREATTYSEGLMILARLLFNSPSIGQIQSKKGIPTGCNEGLTVG